MQATINADYCTLFDKMLTDRSFTFRVQDSPPGGRELLSASSCSFPSAQLQNDIHWVHYVHRAAIKTNY